MSEVSEVTVENTGETYSCAPDTSLLDGALAVGLRMPHNCRGGACGTCKARILEGAVDHGRAMTFAITDEEKAAGYCLCCQAQPRSPRLRLRMVHDMAARDSDELKIVPGEIGTTIIAAHKVTPSVLRLVVAVPRGVRLLYLAGMDMEFLLPGLAAARPYSIAVAPDQENTPPDGQMTFYIARHDKGAASGWLHDNARIGETLTLRGPYGTFGFPEGHDGPVLALAGGTGLAPILAAVSNALGRGFAHPIRLVFSVRSRQEIFALEDLTRLVRGYANFGWTVTLTRDAEAPAGWAKGRVPALLAKQQPDLSSYAALIAGNPAFVEASAAAVRQLGTAPQRLIVDAFVARPTTI